MPLDKLTELLLEPCRSMFEKFLVEHGRDQLIGFALYTCEGYPHVGLIGATKLAQEQSTVCSHDEFLFEPDEWDLMPREDGAREFNNLLEAIYNEGMEKEEENPNWFSAYSERFTVSCVDALADLVDNGVFGSEPERDNLFIMLGVSDSLIPFEEGLNWSQRLNTARMHARYLEFARAQLARRL